MSWHVYRMGEVLEAKVAGEWVRGTFVDEMMPPSHKGVIELADSGMRIMATRDRLRPIGPARGRVS